MAQMRLEGQFKKYDDLLLAYGIADDTVIDERWKSFLKKAGSDYATPPTTSSGKFTMVANYNALKGTFDTLWIMPRTTEVIYSPQNGSTPTPPPANPAPTIPLTAGAQVVMVAPHGEEKRYCDNMPARVLDNVIQTDADEHIYCTKCGFQVPLSNLYDNMPEFTWSELFPGHVDYNGGQKKVADTGRTYPPYGPGNPETPDSGTAIPSPLDEAIKVHFSPVKDDLIWCPEHRGYAAFDTVQNSLNTALAEANPPIVTQIAIPHVLDTSAPGPITDFSATTDRVGVISFRWTIDSPGYPSPTFDLYEGATLIQAGINSEFILDIGAASGPTDYHVKAINVVGTTDSNVASGESL